MKNSTSTNSEGSADPQETGQSPWEQLKTKRIAYLTLPLLVMATIVEFVILATGFRYQQMVCLPQGMGVTFFGIGPIGATILAVELLKLPLAIWTASRIGWQKGFMLFVGLPLICVLTFQLVKDMAVYEMSTAMKPASQFLEQAAAEEIKMTQLKGELGAIEEKKAERERKLTEFAAKHTKAKAELEESLKHIDANRQDAITLTEYQKKELSEVETRQATIIKQFDADTEQLTKALTDLRARRETELARATTWNVEEARIENAYKTKLSAFTNKKTAYEKDKAEYESAGYLKRKVMREPVDPGVPPEREVNKILKPTLVADLEAQIKSKEAELASVNNKRRESVAQVSADARRLREEFDRRSGTKREETDRKREELSAALAAAVTEWKAEEKQMDQDLAAAVKKVDGIRAEVDASRKKAEGFYEAREAAIRSTQVHRIATTVEIVRGLLLGERPMSIKANAKERGDILTDQISMVRIWVYPVLAFIVAFLPTLMVEIGFSTIFKPEQQRPAFRLGFLGRRLHWLYTRAGRQKILRAERMARDATSQIAIRDKALAAANAATEKALAEKRAEVRELDEAIAAATAAYEEQLKIKQSEWDAKRDKALAAANAATASYEEQLKTKQSEWDARFASLTESLNQALVEKDASRDFQQMEIERQVQLRQNVWSDRLTQMGQQLETQHATHEAERTAMVQEHQKKLMEVSEDCRAQVIQARRQMADAELAAEEATARLSLDTKEALNDRDTACAQLQLQVEALSLKLTQAKEDAAREMEKAARQEKHRLERQQMEFAKTLRQRNEELEHQLKLREQELSLEFDTRAAQEQAKVEQAARDREEKFERQVEARVREVDARWGQEVQQREEAAQVRLKQREQQLQAQAEVRLSDLRMQNEQEFRRRELEFDRQLEGQSREGDSRLREELQQKELAFHARLKQREQELTAKSAAREIELQNQLGSALRTRDEEWEKQAESRVRATETRLGIEAKQQEEIFQQKWRQREQQLQAQFEVQKAELKTKWDQDLRDRQQEWERNAEANARANESRWMAEMQQKEELLQSKSRQRDQQWQAKLENIRVELQVQNEQELRRREVESADARQRALRELEAGLRKEMLENDDAAQAEAKQREREFSAQLAAQAEAHQIASQEWKTELEIMRGNIEPFQVLLARTEKERDEARKSADETARQAQELEKKLSEASSFLSGWKNGKNPVAARVGRDGLQVVRGGLEESGEQ